MAKLLNDEAFRHVNYYKTDLRKTFARVRKQQAEERARQLATVEATKSETQRKVRVLK